MKTNFQKELFSLVLFFIISINVFATSYTWTGATSTSWATSTNWSPAGVPSTSDIVTISNQTNNPQLTSNKTVSQLTINSGTLNLNSYTLTISSKSYFYGGTVNNGLVFSSNAISVYFSGAAFGAKINMGGQAIYLNGSTFNDSISLIKTSKSNINSKGGNTFNGYFYYENNTRASIVLSDSLPDIYNSTFVINNIDTGTFYISHRGIGNQFNGDVHIHGKKIYFNYYGTATFSGNIHFYSPAGEIYFGYSTGSSTLVSGKTIVLDSTISSGNLYFQNFTKSGSGSMNFTLAGSSHLYFKGGTTFNSALTCSAPNMHLDGARFLGISSFTNNATANVTALGGNYFGGQTTIVNNSTLSNTFTIGSTLTDTFQTTTTIQNNTGVLSINNALFNGIVSLKNYDTSTTSSRFIISNTGQTKFKKPVLFENIASTIDIGVDGTTIFEDDFYIPDTVVFTSGSYSFTNALIQKSFIFRLNSPDSKLTLNGGNVFNGNFYFTGHDIDVHGTIFNAEVQITKYGSTDMTWSGGNIFNSTTTITDSSTNGHFLKMGNASSDTYNGNVTFIQKGSGLLYPGFNYTSYLKGNVTVGGTSAITFGANNVGNIVFNGSTSQTINKLSAYAPIFKKITINKPGGTLTLNTPVTVTDSILFLKGIINSDTTNLITLNNFGKITGASDSSFVNGPFKKVGNAAFVFPIGKNISYGFRSVEITSPSNSTDAYTAQYIQQGQTLGNTLDTTIEHLNTCEYWKLTRNAGSSKVRLTINWNNDNCNIINPAYMRIAGWNGSLWKDFGTSVYSGDSIKGSSTTMDSTSTISVFTTAPKRCIYFKDVLTKHDVYCRGGSDGMAAVTVTGGTSPYKYSWSGSMGTQAATPTLYPGQYTVSISDSLGCHLSDTVVINEPDSLTISFTKTNSTCGDSSGVVSINATGGTGVVKQYFWTVDGETTQSHDSLSAGEYTVLVTDSNACSAFATVQVSDNNGPSVSLLTISPATCNGGSDGGALIQVASANGPYKIRWSTSENDTLEEINNVSGGFYTVTVTDSLGCMSYDTIEVSQPNIFNVNLNIINTHCGAAEGSAATVVTGGTPPYQYTWTYGIANRGVGETSSYIEHVNSGEGNVIVTDYHGCTTSKKFEILDIGGISVTGNVIANPICFLDTTGSARVIVSGGTTPYSYSWYPRGGNKDTAVNLISDIYTVTVIDGNGCRQKASLLIDSPDELKAYIFGNYTSADTISDGTASSIVYGGIPPYSYSWSSGSTNANVSGLSIGKDTLVVTDNHGCITRNSVDIKKIPRGFCYSGQHTLYHSCPLETFSCSNCTSYVVRNIKTDFGAVGDGVTDDECAFEKASEFFSQIGKFVPKKLIIPHGTYMVGRQDLPDNVGNDVLFFNSMNNLTIQGIPTYGLDNFGHVNKIYYPKMKLLPCMYYGAFNFVGAPPYYRYLIGGDTTCLSAPGNTLASPGVMIRLYDCRNVAINNLELDGNIDNTFIGGAKNGDGFQIGYDGIVINASTDVRINHVNAHHFGRDGIYVNYLVCAKGYPRNWPVMNMTINNSKFIYNGRNNMTWAGGIGLNVSNTEFSYAAQGRIGSKPYSGVDIEYELSNVPNNNGYFKKIPNTVPNYPKRVLFYFKIKKIFTSYATINKRIA